MSQLLLSHAFLSFLAIIFHGETLSAAAASSRCEIASFFHALMRKKRANRIRLAHPERALVRWRLIPRPCWLDILNGGK